MENNLKLIKITQSFPQQDIIEFTELSFLDVRFVVTPSLFISNQLSNLWKMDKLNQTSKFN